MGARRRDVDRLAIEQPRAGRGIGENIGFIDRRDMLARGEHRYNRLGAGDGFGGGNSTGAARFDCARECFFAEVERADVVPHLRPIGGHPAAPVTESDKGDFYLISPSALPPQGGEEMETWRAEPIKG